MTFYGAGPNGADDEAGLSCSMGISVDAASPAGVQLFGGTGLDYSPMPRLGYAAFSSAVISPGAPPAYYLQPYRIGSGFSRQVVLTVQGEYHGTTQSEHAATSPTNDNGGDNQGPLQPPSPSRRLGSRRVADTLTQPGVAGAVGATGSDSETETGIETEGALQSRGQPAQGAATVLQHRRTWAAPHVCTSATSVEEVNALASTTMCGTHASVAAGAAGAAGAVGAVGVAGATAPGSPAMHHRELLDAPTGALATAAVSTRPLSVSTYSPFDWNATAVWCANNAHEICASFAAPPAVPQVFRVLVPARTTAHLILASANHEDSALVVAVRQGAVPNATSYDSGVVTSSSSIPLHNCDYEAVPYFVSVLSHNHDASQATVRVSLTWLNVGPESCEYYTWVPSPWGSCSTQCGVGVASRVLHCQNQAGAFVDVSLCPPQSRPDTSTFCDNGYCEWVTSPWSTCTAQCDGGTQTREVVCRNGDGKGALVPEGLCTDARPAPQQDCNKWPCPDVPYWEKTPWSTCTARCGGGFWYRQVYCSSGMFDSCPGDRPVAIEACGTEPCAQAHFTLTYTDIRQVRSGEQRTDVVDSGSLMYYQYHRFTGSERGVCLTLDATQPVNTLQPGSNVIAHMWGELFFGTILYTNEDGTPQVVRAVPHRVWRLCPRC